MKANSDWIAADFFDFGQEEETKESPSKGNKSQELIYNDYQIKKRKETEIVREKPTAFKPETPLKREKKAKLTFSPKVSQERKKKKSTEKEARPVKAPQRKEQSHREKDREKEKSKKQKDEPLPVYPNFIDDSRES